ncbi:MAG: hypothetical protein V3S94_06730 [Gammaproteobacteria bacterium]
MITNRWPILALALSAQLTAQVPSTTSPDAASRPLLNSERIAQEFGSYAIAILESDDSVRVSNLYSLHGAARICRTYAVVHYPADTDAAVSVEHRAILSGQSIGAVFTERGWAIEKVNRYVGELPASSRVAGLMGGILPQPLAVHIYDLVVSREGKSLTYATIAEIHHPDYLSISELRALYGEVSIAAAGAVREPMLALIRRKMN